MNIKITNKIKVGGRGDNSELKAQSLKRRIISRFQLLIIYINFMQKTIKKVGENSNYGHPTAIVGVVGVVIFVVATAI